MPAALSPAPICMMQPGFPVATRSGRGLASRMLATLSASTRALISGWSIEYAPAPPQQRS